MIYLVIITLCVLLMFIFITEKSRMYLGEVILTTSYVWLVMQINVDVRDPSVLNVLKGFIITFLVMVQCCLLMDNNSVVLKIHNEFKKSNEIRNMKNKLKESQAQNDQTKQKNNKADIDSFIDKCRGKK